jgi:uncharacterized protein YidB (DUF937 family)
MGLLDGLVGNALGSLLGGQPGGNQNPLVGAALQLIQQQGGLPALLGKLQQGGLGTQVASWVSTGENAPVSGQQLGQALGADALNQIGGQLGLDPSAVGQGLSQLLPDLINQMTPNGQVPADHQNVLEQGLSSFLNR